VRFQRWLRNRLRGRVPRAARRDTIPLHGPNLPFQFRRFHFNSGEFQLELGEHCVVETDKGPAYGIVTQPTSPSELYTRKGYPLRKVLRRATFEDRKNFQHAEEREKDAFEYCSKRIKGRHLEMKLVNSAFSLGDQKAIFFFTADGRVDFRALVRDLAARFRVRVEMRQIGVRDAAKMLGGYGDCGRPLCCSTWLKHFEPITIQMAKAQNLSLNPARISGMCGRLKCCLRFEYVPGPRSRKGKGPRPAARPTDQSSGATGS